MKVLFITREGYQLSGARVRCYNFARVLNEMGVEAEVLSFADHLGAKCGEKEFGMSVWQKLWLNFRAFKVLVHEDRDTVFILQRVNYHILAPLLAAFLKKNRFILDCDDWNIRENPVYHFGFYPSSKMEYLTRLVARRAVACIAASSFLKTYLQQFNPHTFYLPTGVNADAYRFFKKPEDGRVVFAWIGTAYHPEMGENLRFVLECFSDLADQFGNVHLNLAGEGKYFEDLRAGFVGHRHEERIRFEGWIPADDVPVYLAGIDAGLLPLVQDTKFNQGKSPTKLFEYMSMGKPVVASDMGEAAQVIRHGRTGFLAKDRRGFIDGMSRLVKDGLMRQSMGLEARKDVEARYALKVLGPQLADILKNSAGPRA
jgi:glycosyltransferase involved in cell wall biosynthesis